NLPAVLHDTRSALIVVQTDQGNLARVLAVPAMRKPPGGPGEPVPVLLLERFATFEAPRAMTRLARGQDLMLFDGFRIDLDSGQVVPEGQGGDLQFLAGKPDGPRLESIGGAKMFTLTSLSVPAAERTSSPSPGREVVPADFNGHYRLFANGQWSGTLDLKVDEGGAVSGQFRSDLQGTTYPVKGQVAAELPRHVQFTVKYPRSQHEFDGYLWTEGKGAIAGTVTLLNQPYGFFALREGGAFAPEGAEVTSDPREPAAGRTLLEIRADGTFVLGGKVVDATSLTAELKQMHARRSNTWVLIRAQPSLPYSALKAACDAIHAAGIKRVTLGAAGGKED
ncbi:MAG TPA: biopolymer transporter ExbD, partial [Isosphaeraceae bacterium]|nr:biopolymer transporter ExbD [Isosphaeraceae bacterium]